MSTLRRRKTLADELNEIRGRVNKLETGTKLRDDSITLNTIRSVKERYNLLDTSSLELWLRMEGSVRDKSDKKNHGTTFNSPTFVSGKEGSAISLDGVDQYVALSDDPFDFGTGDFSISLWLKGDNVASSQVIISKGLFFAVGAGYQIGIASSPADIHFEYSDSGGRSNVRFNTGNNYAGYKHLVAVKTSGNLRAYVDGVESSFSPTAHSRGTSTNALTLEIGRKSGGGNQLNADIDEVRIWSRALTDVEVLELFTYPKPQPHQFEPEHLLSAFYPLEGHTEDMSGFVNNGTETGSPIYVDGILGKAIQFVAASSQLVTIGDILDFDGVVPFSVSFWIKRNDAVDGDIISKHSSGDGGWQIRKTSSNFVRFRRRDSGGGNDTLTGSIVISDTGFTFVVCTFDGTQMRVFCDAVEESSSPLASTRDLPNTTLALTLGASPAGAEHITGVLDEVRIYSRALTATEVTDLFNNIRPSLRDFTMEETETVASEGSSSGACTAFYIGTNPGGSNDCDLIIGTQWAF